MTHEASLGNSRIIGTRAIKLNLENFFGRISYKNRDYSRNNVEKKFLYL